jgi:hypothetical protein
VKKELRPVHDVVACDVCTRTILKGERTRTYVAPGGARHEVCDLCFTRAEHHGWILESALGELPSRAPRPEPRRGMLGRMRRRREAGSQGSDEPDDGGAGSPDRAQYEPEPEPPPRPRSRPKDPRHVRAVPTTAGGKVERALELFNGSSHHRTVAGLARTLGVPFVGAQPDASQPSAVTLVVAWELSWYRYRVDLGDEADPVMMLEKGDEIEEIDESLREWNATLDAEGRVLVGQAVTDGGTEG